MTIANQLLAEFEEEWPTTRKFVERLPGDKLEWKPHPKSMSAGQLALHIAEVPGQIVQLAQMDEFSVPEFNRPNTQPASVQVILQKFDESVATVKQILPTFTDQQMQAPWKLKVAGKQVLEVPRAKFLRNIMLNHWYHHRGQFGVYLRLVGANVPSSYGPSGDEMPDFIKDAGMA
jgi:uncharacterized damage-inducible protein DinB